MSVVQAIVLGLVQGLTEFLPISSSGHLIFIPKLFGWANQGVDFDVIVHLGTLLALVIYFREKLWLMFKAFFSKKVALKEDRKLAWLIILATIPAGLAGLFLENKINNLYSHSISIIGFSFIFWGIVLWIADWFADSCEKSKDPKIQKSINEIGWKKSIFIGCAQVLALIPGTSRSGITMTAGLFAKLNKKTTAEFSFLVSVPIIALAGLSGLWHLAKIGFNTVGLVPLSIGFITSAVSGLLGVWVLLKIIQKWSFKPFVIYRIIIGLIILFLL